MKIFFSVLSLFLLNITFAQIPENNKSESNELIHSNSFLMESEVREKKKLDSIGKNQLKENRTFPKTRTIKSRAKLNNSQSGYSSQSIQSSQIIEMEYQQSRKQSNSRMISPESQKRMGVELEKIGVDAAASFEYNLYKYTLGSYNSKMESFIDKAEQLRPNDQRVVLQKLANECVKGDTISVKQYLTKLKGNQTLDDETLAYAEDVLVSSRGNDILITHGINDTYGIMYHQLNAMDKVDEKIVLISLDLLRSEQYRALLRGQGVRVPSSTNIDTEYFKQLCALNSKKKIAISLTLPVDYLRKISSFAVPYGLVLITGNQNKLCFSDLQKLWDSKLNKRNITAFSSTQSKNYAKNYVPTQKLLERFERQQGVSPYINAKKKLTPQNNSKVGTPNKQ